MKEQLYEQLLNSPGLSKLKTDLDYYTSKNIKLLYDESNVLSKEFIINPYIAIEHNSGIMYPIIDFYDNLIIQSELITPYDSILLSIREYESKINGYAILDMLCGENNNPLLKENLNFLLRKYFSCLFIINH